MHLITCPRISKVGNKRDLQPFRQCAPHQQPGPWTTCCKNQIWWVFQANTRPLPHHRGEPYVLRVREVQYPIEKESLQRLDSGLICHLRVICIDRNRRVPHRYLIHRRRVEQSPKPIPKAQYCLTTADIRDSLNRETFWHETTKTLISWAWRVNGLRIRTNNLWQPAMVGQIPAEAEWPQCSHSPVRREIVGYDKYFFRPPTHDSNQTRLDWPQAHAFKIELHIESHPTHVRGSFVLSTPPCSPLQPYTTLGRRRRDDTRRSGDLRP
jgi:hypothetical protein